MYKNLNADILNKMKNKGYKIGIIEIIFGAILFLLPNLLPGIIMLTMGIIFSLIAVIYIAILIKSPKEITKFYSYILPGCLLLLGIYTMIYPINVVSIIAWIFGIGTVIKGVATLLSINSPIKSNGYKLAGLFSVIIGVVIIMASSNVGELFSYYIGFSLAFNGILDLWHAHDIGKMAKIVDSDQYVI